MSTKKAERPGRPKQITSQEMIDKIHDMVPCNLSVFLIEELACRKKI